MSVPAQSAALVPVLHWRGARSDILDLSRDQSGWVLALVLVREGDCCLLPVAWLYEQPAEVEEHLPPGYPLEADALHSGAFKQTMIELDREGWQVSGRLEIHFTGQDVEPNFWPAVEAHLWQ
jgi:hypothetical protein